MRGTYLDMLAKPNQLEHARLGTIVAKKVAASAVARNYMKRTLRELFRTQPGLPALDFVLQVNKRFSRAERARVASEFADLAARATRCLEHTGAQQAKAAE